MVERRSSFTLGAVLLGVGVLALLVRYGGFDVFHTLFRLWPLILVYLGLRMIFPRHATPRDSDADLD